VDEMDRSCWQELRSILRCALRGRYLEAKILTGIPFEFRPSAIATGQLSGAETRESLSPAK
jgi:hypothetical protein